MRPDPHHVGVAAWRATRISLGADRAPAFRIARPAARPSPASAIDPGRASLWAALVLALVVAAPPAAAQDTTIDYPRDARAVVVAYREILGEIGEPDNGPSLTVHGDGRMLVHYPAYMRSTGDYVAHLDAAEMRDLVRALGPLVDFDEAGVRAITRSAVLAGARAALASGGTVSDVADASTTVIELNLERASGTAGARRVVPVAKRIRWDGLRYDAQRHRQLGAIQDLAAAEGHLRTLMQRPGLERVR